MNAIKLFESWQVRSEWDAAQKLWFFSIVDVVCVPTDSVDSAAYWRKLKQRLRLIQSIPSPKADPELTDEWEYRGISRGGN